MDFLTGKLKSLYFKYLAAAFGSALVTSIYSIVDMAIVDNIKDRMEQQLWLLLHQSGILFLVWDY